MKMSFLDALSMVSLRIGKTKEPLLEKVATVSSAIEPTDTCLDDDDSLFLVPERKGNVLKAVGVGDASNSIFTPSVGSRSCVVVGKVWGPSVSGLQLELSWSKKAGGRSSRLHASPSGL